MVETGAKDKSAAVAIIGGGPVGLFLAIELGLKGQACRLIERRNGEVTVPKMNLVHVRTMEHLRRLGLEQAVRDAGWPHDYPLDVILHTGIHGHEIIRFRMPSDCERDDSAFTPAPLQRCPQTWFDPLLLRTAANIPRVEILLNTEMLEFSQDECGVQYSVRTAGGEVKEFQGSYLVACDGADSSVRSKLGIALNGSMALDHNMNVFFHSTDLLRKNPLGKASNYFELGPRGIERIISPINGSDLWRLGVRVNAETSAADFPARDILRDTLGSNIQFELLTVTKWTRREVVAERYREGRIFLAGDSAHQLTPNGGQGMNTGIGDAVDLAWKLDAVLKGWGGDGLLDTYGEERRPIAELIVGTATSYFRKLVDMPTSAAIGDDTPEGENARDEVARFCRAKQVHFSHESEGLQLNWQYESSSIVVPDGSPEPVLNVATPMQTARPGSRAPHVWLADGHSTLDLFGKGFTLLAFREKGAEALIVQARERGIPLSVQQITNRRVACIYGADFVIVRPDGYVAWRGDKAPACAELLWDRLRGQRRRSSELPCNRCLTR
ncbi:hypothetical protein FXB41_13560 [Bradyrhizobium canariense]|uniref:FAD-dependent monooxygenase n=1 Tax=Bradyrhizobium canariense TaxID=255045 RepID=UPI001CA5324D|nr:FAD-dependent monooxygenase [Bradyrhizobium canariense]MBW5435775.1 hypothetical protein [Bradyrhizobium canariense]